MDLHDYSLDGLRTWAQVDLDAVNSNFEEARTRLPEDTKFLAVIKANAYGHGAARIARLLEDRCDYFAVAMLEEAIALRYSGIGAPVLILGYTPSEKYSLLVKYDITPTIDNLSDARLLNEKAGEAGKKAKIHIAIDTGMSRIGFDISDKSADEIDQIYKMPNLVCEGIFSHFATADEADKNYCYLQLYRFTKFEEKLREHGIVIPVRHIFNSAAVMELSANFEMVRAGIILYGLYPSDEVVKSNLPLVPAMSLKSRVVFVKTLETGVPVSYGCTYVTTKKTRVATICAGYADGLPRLLSNSASVLICGKRAPIIGRICMDQLMADITDIPEAETGSEVTVFGRDGNEEIPVGELARLCGTIGYELVCGISARVPRVYYQNGKIIGIDSALPLE